MTREELILDANCAFRCWVTELTMGELKDMLTGSAWRYRGIPDLSSYSAYNATKENATR